MNFIKFIKLLDDICEKRIIYTIKLIKQEPFLLSGITIKPLTLIDYLNCELNRGEE